MADRLSDGRIHYKKISNRRSIRDVPFSSTVMSPVRCSSYGALVSMQIVGWVTNRITVLRHTISSSRELNF